MNEWKAISISAWEQSFAAQRVPLDPHHYGDVVREAAKRGKVAADALLDDGADGYNIVCDVLEPYRVGRIGLRFPESMHGDGLVVEISRFPAGTAVGFLWTTYSGARIVFAIRRASLRTVVSAAIAAIWREQDGAEFTSYEEGEDWAHDPCAAVWYGEKELAKTWKKAARAKPPLTPGRRSRRTQKSHARLR